MLKLLNYVDYWVDYFLCKVHFQKTPKRNLITMCRARFTIFLQNIFRENT